MSFSMLSSAWLAMLLVPLVAFYFLKLRRPRQEVSSLVLWRQVLGDRRVNSPFQRFKRNLLLLLQVLLLALLVLAATQPVWHGAGARAPRLPVLIDVSASMAALDAPGGISRLEAVRRRLRERIDALPTDQEMCLVAFGRTARRLTGFTNNRSELRAALAALEPEDVEGDLEEALRTAQALGRNEAFERVLLCSDGNFPARSSFELPFRIDFERVPAAGGNVGITACSARRVQGRQWEVFVQLAASSAAEAAMGTVELLEEGVVLASQKVALKAGAAPRLLFRVGGAKASRLEVRLTPGGFDALAADNAAWLELPALRTLEVYVPPALATYRQALEAIEGLRLSPQADAAMPAQFDLAFAADAGDLERPARVLCTVGVVPPALAALVKIEKGEGRAVDWRREAPLLQHVSLADVLMLEAPRNAAGVNESNYANLGFEVLAHGVDGPLLLERREAGRAWVHLLFHTDRSTLPYRVGFPVLVSNLVNLALLQAGLGDAEAAQTGVLPALQMAPGRVCSVAGPGGSRREAKSDEEGRLAGVPATRAGEYEVSGGIGVARRLGVSVLSARETGLEAVGEIEFGDRLKVSTAGVAGGGERALWWPLTLAGLVVLLVEWWYFQRRPTAAN